MAQENNNDNPSFGEISTIRDILMGQQMTDYEMKFQQIQQNLQQLETRFSDHLVNLSNQQEQRMSDLEKEMNERFNQMEKILAENMNSLHQKIDTVSKEDKQSLGAMLSEIGKRLMDSENK